MTPPGVLMVTGAYYPELSGGGLQCRQLVRALGDRARFTILTTSADTTLASFEQIDGVPVYRINIDVTRVTSKSGALLALTSTFIRLRREFAIVHLHGFSQKTMVLVALAKLFGKKLIVKLTSVGHDDPPSIRRRGRTAFWFYSRTDLFLAVSPRLEQLYLTSGLRPDAIRMIPNGVDLQHFRPADEIERLALRRELGLPQDAILILFVGFFSHEKRPDLLFDAWERTLGEFASTALVFVGATRSAYYEVDPALAEGIRARSRKLAVDGRVLFVEKTLEIEKYYRAADLFVLPSTREGLPNALLEAMASGLPCIASRLAGVTDAIIDDGRNGVLVTPGEVSALESALTDLLRDRDRARRLGASARKTVEKGYSMAATARACLEAYRHVITN